MRNLYMYVYISPHRVLQSIHPLQPLDQYSGMDPHRPQLVSVKVVWMTQATINLQFIFFKINSPLLSWNIITK